MILLAKFNAIILTNYLVFSFGHLNFAFGDKPKCKGEALHPDKFSAEEDVGLVRDVSVDIIARNIYNTLKYPVSKLCEELANMRTSTCLLCICIKWKRSSSWNKPAAIEVMNLADRLMRSFLEDVSKDKSFNEKDGKFIFDRINEGKTQLIESGAATEQSKIMDPLEDMKMYLCKRCAVSENKDSKILTNQFIRNFEAENEVKILTNEVQDNVIKEVTVAGIVRLKFEFKQGEDIKASRVILKIPSLAPLYHTELKKTDVYAREALFYEKILPTLYQWGKCEPFAPKLYAATPTKALALEDLSVDGFKSDFYTESLDLDHTVISLNILALYHALSYKYLRSLNREDPSMSLLDSSKTNSRNEFTRNMVTSLCVFAHPVLSDSLYRKIFELQDKVRGSLDTKRNLENSMTVIIHGDFQARNIFHKYDSNGKVIQAKIIDWQMAREASPVIDLIEFIVPNIDIDIFEAHEDYLLDSYLGILNQNLSSISADRVYSRQELDSDMKFFKDHYLRILSNIAAENLSFDPEERKPLAEKIAKWLEHLEKRGFL